MNNYHLFLIRSDGVTQLTAHLLAGILALALFVSLDAPKDAPLAPPVRQAHVMDVVLPASTAVLAATETQLR